MSKNIYIGFWKEPSNSDWVNMPIENSARECQANLISLLEDRQNTLYRDGGTRTDYLGHSTCRICAKWNNGCSEYCIDGFVWPEGYMHYLKEHNVEVDNEEFKQYLATASIRNNKQINLYQCMG